MTEQYGNELPLSSGYKIFIRPLPPYYKDLIDNRFPLPDYPKRKIMLAAGDEVEWPYEPPEEPLTVDHEDYDLFIHWHDIHRRREQIEKLKHVARVDYLLSMCVDVKEGIYKSENEEWSNRLEAAFEDFQVPKHPGKRYLYFLKHVVITTTEELDVIINLCTSPEVTMQGIMNALRGFQDLLERGRDS